MVAVRIYRPVLLAEVSIRNSCSNYNGLIKIDLGVKLFDNPRKFDYVLRNAFIVIIDFPNGN